MTREKAFTLEPGQELQWLRRPASEPKDRNGGAYRHEICAETEGGTVEFVDYVEPNETANPKVCILASGRRIAVSGSFDMPLIKVRTLTGVHQFASGHFQ